MTGKKKVLGRGLASLLPDFDSNKKENFFECDTDIILPNKYQPRNIFSENSINELAESIKKQGIIQPLIVKKKDDKYELIAGERRLIAAKKAGFTKVPVIVKDISDSEHLILSIIENIQREDLNSIEVAYAYKRLIDEFSLTQEQVAETVGKSRSGVANLLRLLKLSDEIKNAVKNEILSMGHARALLSAENDVIQNRAFEIIIKKKLSVRETERLLKKLNKEAEDIKEKKEKIYYFKEIEDSLSDIFGSKVKIFKKTKKGKIEIEFKNDDDLQRLIGIFNEKNMRN